MSVLEIVSAGLAASVQDGGRFGAQRYGLPPSGAMDRLSLAAANALVDKEPFDAAIEFGPLPMTFTGREGSVRVAITGALRTVQIGDRNLPLYQSFLLRPDETLTLGAAREGVFGYLAIEGQIVGDPVFGSYSVNVRAGLGAPYPRNLRAGDRLEVTKVKTSPAEKKLVPPSFHKGPIRVVLGPQEDEFGEACDVFLNSEWRVLPSSDRMGYRLAGPALSHDGGFNIVSDGTVDGSIQVAGDGQPIVLMRDRGTTGGYPKIATVISSDLGRLAQTRPNRSVRFEAISVEEAQREAGAFAHLIQSLPDRVTPGDVA